MQFLSPLKLTSARLLPLGRKIKIRKPFGEHGHATPELFWVESGHGYHRVNGVERPLQPGSFATIRTRDRHSFGPDPGDTVQLTVLELSCEAVNSLGARYFPQKPLFFWSLDTLPWMVEMDASQLRQLNEWADVLARAPVEAFHLDRFLMNVFAELSCEHEADPEGAAPGWFLRACAEAPGHLEAGVEGFFNLCGRSRKHVSRTMQRYRKTTPTDYMNKLRMSYARRQLEMGNQEILDIALDCGIDNLSHFYKLFRKETGTTPRAYRLRYRMAQLPMAGGINRETKRSPVG